MTAAKVAILCCTHNSERYLRDQLDSYFRQTHADWELWVSDDGSRDGTAGIVREYGGRGKRISIVAGPRRGATANFLSILRAANTDADFFAWSDADDIWLPDKLERAVSALGGRDPDRPAMYCGRTMIVDADNAPRRLSPLFSKLPAFRNALCQNIAGGNTMVFNRAATALLRHGDVPDVFFHDWWAYILVSGCGGRVHYDPTPCLRYRQHGANLIGDKTTFWARLERCRKLFRHELKRCNMAHVAALETRRSLLTDDSRHVVDAFAGAARAGRILERMRLFNHSGVLRQRRLESAALWLATLAGAYP